MRVLPDGCVELIIHFATPYRSWHGSDPQPKAFIAGQISRAITLSPLGNSSVFAIRFNPSGFCQFTPIPLQDFTDREVELVHFWPSANAFTDSILAASTFQTRCALTDYFLLDLLRRTQTAPDPIVAWCLAQLHLGTERIDVLATQTGYSVRQLERRFLQSTGLSPKRLTRIFRLQRLVQHLETGSAANLTTLAHALGYADQAHMSRDFKQLVGLTPSAYLGKEEPLYFDDVSR